MDESGARPHRSHGTGEFTRETFRAIGQNVVLEAGVLVFHPENIEIEDNVYVGHQTILKGYYKNTIHIGQNTWIGQGCFFHGAGGLRIGRAVGVGPLVKILTSTHVADDLRVPVLHSPLRFDPVVVEDGADIGVGAVILPGVTIGEGVIVGAGAVVAESLPPFTVCAGVPARVLRQRP